MREIKVDFTQSVGNVKPMNAVNNGPAGSRARMTGNFPYYERLGIPYARLHDSSFYFGNYGGEFAVDVHRVFPDFSKDENDPASYLFAPTDSYLEDIVSVNTEIYYRLGASIEHGYKKGTYPPADFAKWARICEHIIRHYTEGWANGYRHKITYWEIWNEPDCRNPDGSNPCWQGTDEEFFDLFEITAKHLKSCFPNLKIGGPALAGPLNREYVDAFCKRVTENKVPMDFFSFHWYGCDPHYFEEFVNTVLASVKECGLGHLEMHLNEWNFVRAWTGEEYSRSMECIGSEVGAAFVGSIMAVAHRTELDMLMYYDARPTTWCGLFTTHTHTPKKPYYAMLAFSELKKLGTAVYSEISDDIYSLAATNGTEHAVMLSRFNDGKTQPETVRLELCGITDGTPVKAEYYLLDKEHNLELVKEDFFTVSCGAVYLKMPDHTLYLIKLTEM